MADSANELTAGDVMEVAVKTVPSHFSLPELEQEFLAAGVSGFPVVDKGMLVGVISRSDVIRQLCSEREVAEKTSDFYFGEVGFQEDRMGSFQDIADRVGERIESLLVRDVMVPNPRTIPIDYPVSDIARQFLRHHIHRLPVTDHGTLIGMVTTMNLVRLIADRRLRHR